MSQPVPSDQPAPTAITGARGMQSERSEIRASHPPVRRDPTLPSHDARDLTEGGHSAEICLDGARYLLRITRQGKLILTK